MGTTKLSEKCARCGTFRPQNELNHEARIHHSARQVECVDRKACTRRARRKK